MNDTVDRSAQASRSLEIFAFLWAWAAIFHQGKTGIWAKDGIDVLMTFTAVAVIIRPTNLANFLSFVVVQLADMLFKLPNLVNHAVIMLVANATIVAAAIREAVRRPGMPIDKGALYETFAPVVRVGVVIVYFYVVFHKLNWDYLDPTYSAAVVHYENLAGTLTQLGLPSPPLTLWARYAAIYGTLIIEGGIPLLLAFRATRIAGLWLGLVFHFMLSVEDFYDFTTVAYALLFLFAPENFPALLEDWWSRSRLSRIAARIGGAPIFRTVPLPVWLVGAVVVVVTNLNIFDSQTSFRVFKVLWMFYGLAVVVAFAGAMHARRTEAVVQRATLFRLPSPVFAIFPLIFFLNGASPYLGLKTRSCYSMFSNLRTEGGQTNHLIVPVSAQLADFQNEMVVIVESSDPSLAKLAKSGASIPLFNLRKMISEGAKRGKSGTSVQYTLGDRTITVADAEKDPVLSKPYPYLMRKLLLFGETNPGPHQVNRH